METTQKPSPNFKAGRQGYNPEIICIHIMAGTLAGTDSWFANPVSQVSAHYGVGFAGEVRQYVQDADTAWAQGVVNSPTFKLYKPGINPNLYCLSIENEGQDLSTAPAEQINALCDLIRGLCDKYGIPKDRDHIIGHYQINAVTRPNCPATDKTVLDRIVAQVAQGGDGNAKVVALLEQVLELLKKQ